MKQKKDFREWQQDAQEDRIDRERKAKQKALDDAANSYQVIKDGEIVHSTHNHTEAIRTAQNIVNSRVLWLIDNCGIRYIYPDEN